MPSVAALTASAGFFSSGFSVAAAGAALLSVAALTVSAGFFSSGFSVAAVGAALPSVAVLTASAGFFSSGFSVAAVGAILLEVAETLDLFGIAMIIPPLKCRNASQIETHFK